MPAEPWLRPEWPAPLGVLALMSTRLGGVSSAPYRSLNLRPPGLPAAQADAPAAVLENQRRFAAALGATPVWLNQVHGARVLRLAAGPQAELPQADASISTVPGLACTVLVADCLPVLLCHRAGTGVGAAHAGWRGLAVGVLEHTVAALCEACASPPADLLAWLGPCIGPRQFEVGADVLQAFVATAAGDQACFVPRPRADGSPRWLADLPGLARARLARLGVAQVSGGHWCTVEDGSRFFSYRRNPVTGRLAAAVALRG